MRGTNGFSYKELLMMPDSIVVLLLGILMAIEAGTRWPSVLTTALTVCLSKSGDAKIGADVGPIAIFSDDLPHVG